MCNYRTEDRIVGLVCKDCNYVVCQCACINAAIRNALERLTNLEKNDHTHADDNTITRLENLRNGLLNLDDRVAILEKAVFRNPATMPMVYDSVNNVFILNDGGKFYPSVDGKLSNQPLGKAGQFWNAKTNQWEDQPFGSKPVQPMESVSGSQSVHPGHNTNSLSISPLESLLQDKINERDKEVERLDQTFKLLMQNYEIVLNDRDGLKEQFIGMGRLVDDLKHSVTALNNEKALLEKNLETSSDNWRRVVEERNDFMAQVSTLQDLLNKNTGDRTASRLLYEASHDRDKFLKELKIAGDENKYLHHKINKMEVRKCPRCTCTYDEAVCAIEN